MGRSLRDLDEAEWDALYEKVLLFARSLARDVPRATDLTQEAFSRLLTTRPWNEEGGVSLFRHMTGIVRSVASNERTSKREHVERSAATELDLTSGTATPSAEEAHLARATESQRQYDAASALAELSTRLSGYPLELALLSAMLDGMTQPARLALHLQRPIADVYVALRRIRRRAQTLAKGDRSEAEDPHSEEELSPCRSPS